MTTGGPDVLTSPDEDGAWVGMRRACEILGVNQSTLRQWTDAGRVPFFLTPGGHRRYRVADLRALAAPPPTPATTTLATVLLGSQDRYQAVIRKAVQTSSWYGHFDDAARRQFRLLGASMLGLLTTYVGGEGRRERERALTRGRELAAEYGEMAARLGLTQAEATEAFLLFRNPVLETVHRWLAGQGGGAARTGEALRRVNTFMDHVLVAMAGAHERTTGGRGPTPPADDATGAGATSASDAAAARATPDAAAVRATRAGPAAAREMPAADEGIATPSRAAASDAKAAPE